MKSEFYNRNGIEVQVYFDDLKEEVIDRVDHSTFYGITGYDAHGNEYTATSEFCCGEFEGITDIEPM